MREQNWQFAVASGLYIAPPAICIYGDRYWAQVFPEGGWIRVISISEQVTFVFANPAESIALIRYVNGETRYINIQKPGKLEGVAMTLLMEMVSDNLISELSIS